MDCTREHGRCLAYITWVFTIAIMIGDFLFQIDDVETFAITKIPESTYFYLITNAVLLFRVFGVHWFVKFLHFAFTVAAIPVLVLGISYISMVNAAVLIVLTGLQILLAFHFVLIRPGRSPVERAYRVGIHATGGLAVTFIYYLLTCFLIKPDKQTSSVVLEMIYMLLFLFMVLTPYCQSPDQAVPQAEEERRRILTLLLEREKDRYRRKARSSVDAGAEELVSPKGGGKKAETSSNDKRKEEKGKKDETEAASTSKKEESKEKKQEAAKQSKKKDTEKEQSKANDKEGKKKTK